MQIIYKKVEELKPYENNPRINDDAVASVALSISEFGFKVPMVIDKDGIVVTGHTRLKAAIKLGLKEVPCIIADDLSDEQIKAFRIADNSTSQLAQWDLNKLSDELKEIDFDMEGFGLDEQLKDIENNFKSSKELKEKYTQKTNIPQYEITGKNPSYNEMIDKTKYEELIKEINESNIPEDEKEFLRYGACRHIVFNYANIAEHYAHSSKEVQELMEKSALVIIDINDAMKNGYFKFNKDLSEIVEEYNDGDEA